MPLTLMPLAVVVFLVFMTTIGDFYIKTSTSLSSPFLTWQFGVGFLLYALGAFGWFYAMKHMPLTEMGVVYSCLTIIILRLLGTFVFNEAFSTREFLGVTLAIAAVLVIHDWTPTFAYFAQTE